MVALYAQSPPVSIICSTILAIIVYLALQFSPCSSHKKKKNIIMDPAEDLPPPPVFFPPLALAADAPPPASTPTAASLSGPKIFVLSALPGNKYDADRFFPFPFVSSGFFSGS